MTEQDIVNYLDLESKLSTRARLIFNAARLVVGSAVNQERTFIENWEIDTAAQSLSVTTVEYSMGSSFEETEVYPLDWMLLPEDQLKDVMTKYYEDRRIAAEKKNAEAAFAAKTLAEAREHEEYLRLHEKYGVKND